MSASRFGGLPAALALLTAIALPACGNGQAQAVAPADRAQRQERIWMILHDMPLDGVNSRRQMCAWGISGELDAAIDRALETRVSDRLGEECLALLTRLALDGELEFIRDNRAPAAAAIDEGFVTGFLNSGEMPRGLPGVAEMKPIAQRCFAQQETNLRLCSSAGFVLGLRAQHGEVVTAD